MRTKNQSASEREKEANLRTRTFLLELPRPRERWSGQAGARQSGSRAAVLQCDPLPGTETAARDAG